MAGQSTSLASVGAKIVQEGHLICTKLDSGNNKYWDIYQYDDNLVESHYGRVGDKGIYCPKAFHDSYSADVSFTKQMRDKQAGNSNSGSVYKPRAAVRIGSTATVQAVTSSSLATLAVNQIATNNPETLKLVKYLAHANQHNIVSQTTLTFSDSDNLFKTAMNEVVTPEGVSAARSLLAQIADYVARQDFDSPKLSRFASDYLEYVPSNIGRKRLQVVDLYPNLAAVQKQNDILDALEGSFAAMQAPAFDSTNTDTALSQQQLFKVKLHTVDDGKIIDHIRKFYKSTWQSIHTASTLDVLRVFEVEIDCMASIYAEEGVKFGNVMELWHGTKKGNLLSLLKSGFVIPPASSSHCTGRVFGNGVYFSDQSTKSLNYAGGWAPGQKSGGYDGNAFMFLNDVAMGNSYTPQSSMGSFPKAGYDSTFAKARISGVANNEMVVYSTKQINPKYLVQFSENGK